MERPARVGLVGKGEGKDSKMPFLNNRSARGRVSALSGADGPALMVTREKTFALSALAPAIGRHAHAWQRTTSFEPCWDNAHPARTRLSTCGTRLGSRGTRAKEQQVLGFRQSYLWNREGVVAQNDHGGEEEKEIKAQALSRYVPIVRALQLLPGTQSRIPIASFLLCHTATQALLPCHLK